MSFYEKEAVLQKKTAVLKRVPASTLDEAKKENHITVKINTAAETSIAAIFVTKRGTRLSTVTLTLSLDSTNGI